MDVFLVVYDNGLTKMFMDENDAKANSSNGDVIVPIYFEFNDANEFLINFHSKLLERINEEIEKRKTYRTILEITTANYKAHTKKINDKNFK